MDNPLLHSKIHFYVKISFLSLGIGITSGITVSLFLICLSNITNFRFDNPNLIYGLPLIGLFIPLIYRLIHFDSIKGFKLILMELKQSNKIISWLMAPLIFSTTLLSHLVGASVGRESTALQISTSLADNIGYWFSFPYSQRALLLRAGLSGGFAAALGAPLSGMIFGLEVLQTTQWKKWKISLILVCLISGFSSSFISHLLNAPHFTAFEIEPPEFSSLILFHLLAFALFIGILSRLYSESLRQIELHMSRFSYYWKGFLGGILLLMLYVLFPLSAHHGLGLESIQSAFIEPSNFEVPLIKLLLTIFSISIGFKGGDFIPLVFIGTTTGSALAHHWQEPISFFSALGFVSLFGSATKTPLSCSFLACELFGWRLLPYALLMTFASYATAGPHGIYSVENS